MSTRKHLSEIALNAIKNQFLFDSVTMAHALMFRRHYRLNLIKYGYSTRNLIERRENRKFLQIARSKFNAYDSPLISVIIPTYNRGKILTERAVPSVLGQTYQNFELIIIGDNCTDNTEALIKKFSDKRIKFYNLPKRGNYPKNPLYRWLVAGSIPRNEGLKLAMGEWIAPLDDDDEFSNNHLELLLNHARENQYELVYGILKMELGSGNWSNCGSFPLAIKEVCHSAVLYSSVLKFLEYDSNAWKYLEPDDWNLWRRMKEAGARIGFIDKVVGKHFQEHNPNGP